MKPSNLLLLLAGFFLGATDIDIKGLIGSYPAFFILLGVIILLDVIVGFLGTIYRTRKAIRKSKSQKELMDKFREAKWSKTDKI